MVQPDADPQGDRFLFSITAPVRSPVFFFVPFLVLIRFAQGRVYFVAAAGRADLDAWLRALRLAGCEVVRDLADTKAVFYGLHLPPPEGDASSDSADGGVSVVSSMSGGPPAPANTVLGPPVRARRGAGGVGGRARARPLTATTTTKKRWWCPCAATLAARSPPSTRRCGQPACARWPPPTRVVETRVAWRARGGVNLLPL